jgi:hypothetical protein
MVTDDPHSVRSVACRAKVESWSPQTGTGQARWADATSRRRLVVAVLAGLAAGLLAPAPAFADRTDPRRPGDRDAAWTNSRSSRPTRPPHVAPIWPTDWDHLPTLPDMRWPTGVPRPELPQIEPPAMPPARPKPEPPARPRPEPPGPSAPPVARPDAPPAARPATPAVAPTKPAHTKKPKPEAGAHTRRPARSDRRPILNLEPTDAPATGDTSWLTEGSPMVPTPKAPAVTPTGFDDQPPSEEPTSGQGAVSSGDLVDARAGLGEDFHRSLIYSGVMGLSLAIVGLAMIAWRRRLW